MRFSAVRLRASRGKGKVHKRTLERVAHGPLVREAGMVLCNTNWSADHLEPASSAPDCDNCARRERELRGE